MDFSGISEPEYDYAILYDSSIGYEPSEADYERIPFNQAPLPAEPMAKPEMQQQGMHAATSDSSSELAVVREFEDANLIREMDAALEQLEANDQKQKQQQQYKQSHKAAGLMLPGSQKAAAQEAL